MSLENNDSIPAPPAKSKKTMDGSSSDKQGPAIDLDMDPQVDESQSDKYKQLSIRFSNG